MRIYAYKGGILLENKGSRLFLTAEGKGELITGYYSHFSFNLKNFRANSGCFPQRRGVPLPGTAFHRGNGLHSGCDPSYRSWPVPKTKSRLFHSIFKCFQLKGAAIYRIERVCAIPLAADERTIAKCVEDSLNSGRLNRGKEKILRFIDKISLFSLILRFKKMKFRRSCASKFVCPRNSTFI